MIKLQVIGLKELQKITGEARSKTEKVIKDALLKASLLVTRESMIKTPVDTGRLRSSYRLNYRPFRTEVYPTVHYAVYVHEREFTKTGKKVYHKVGMAKFMTKAVEVSIEKIKKLFREAMEKVFKYGGLY